MCLPCLNNCQECTDGVTCTRCVPGTVARLGGVSVVECRTCGLPDCALCNENLDGCLLCRRGYLLINDTCTASCGTGCQECSPTDSTTCLKCMATYALRNDSTCVKCLSGCSGTCNPKNIALCMSCTAGFQLLDNRCVRCPFGCLACAGTQCTACLGGYRLAQLSGNVVCIQECLAPCLECTATVCTRCHQGHTLQTGFCVPQACNASC